MNGLHRRSTHHMELEQGKAHNLNHHMVGITSVYEAGGSKLVSLNVLEPTTRKETPHRLQVGDMLSVGTDRYKIVTITMATGPKKASITIQKA